MIIKPIKRNANLAPFSREHHDVLLFCWKIKEGIRLKIDSARIVGYCEWFFEQYIKQHFKEEEERFAKILPADHPILMTMFEDHEAINSWFEGLLEYAPADHLKRFADIITYHIRFEERQLFQIIERVASKEQLQEVFAGLDTKPGKMKDWEDQFWIQGKEKTVKVQAIPQVNT